MEGAGGGQLFFMILLCSIMSLLKLIEWANVWFESNAKKSHAGSETKDTYRGQVITRKVINEWMKG